MVVSFALLILISEECIPALRAAIGSPVVLRIPTLPYCTSILDMPLIILKVILGDSLLWAFEHPRTHLGRTQQVPAPPQSVLHESIISEYSLKPSQYSLVILYYTHNLSNTNIIVHPTQEYLKGRIEESGTEGASLLSSCIQRLLYLKIRSTIILSIPELSLFRILNRSLIPCRLLPILILPFILSLFSPQFLPTLSTTKHPLSILFDPTISCPSICPPAWKVPLVAIDIFVEPFDVLLFVSAGEYLVRGFLGLFQFQFENSVDDLQSNVQEIRNLFHLNDYKEQCHTRQEEHLGVSDGRKGMGRGLKP